MGVGEIAWIDQDEQKLGHPSLRASSDYILKMFLPNLLLYHSRGTAPVPVPLRPSSEALLILHLLHR